MNIIATNLAFRGSMANRSHTNRIVVHHAEASTCSADDIHRWHLANGWSGAGYHYLVRKDGSVYALRPANKIGAHAAGSNSDSIGICFEGNYMTEESMPQAQMDAGRELIAQLKSKWGVSTVLRHKDVCNTDCPGANFPFDALVGSSHDVSVPSQPASKPAVSPRPSGWSQWVSQLQEECNRQGFSSQNVDGLAGPVTLAGCPTCRRGARGVITRLLQERLVALGYSCGSAGVDGIFGNGTEDSVREYQAEHCLAVDGIVGRNTWASLLGLQTC